MTLRALALLTLVVVSAATPALAQQSDPSRLCAILPPKLGGLDACRTAVAADPRDPSALGNLATAYLAADQQNKAVETYRTLVALRPDSADVRLDIAKIYDRRGDLKRALAEYREFSRILPDAPRANFYVGSMLLELKQYEEALAEFRRAVAGDSLQGRYMHALGAALAGLGRREEAYIAYEHATRLRPEDAAMWGVAGRAAHATGRIASAVYNWDHAINLQPAYFDRRADERVLWERSIRELGSNRVAVIGRPVQIESPVSGRRESGNGKAASFTGSGFWVSSEGHLLTNRHVVKGCREIRVRPDSGSSQLAVLVATDGHDDLALLKTSRPYPLIAQFREGRSVRRGEDVVAVGFPLNGLLADQANVTVGQISALAGIYNDSHVLQMTTPVQQGNSGGPLFDASGNVVGVVVTKLNARAMAAEIGDFPQNVNFAIKSDIARKFLEANRVIYRTSTSQATRSNPDIGDMGRVVTVLVECFQ
jgi:S1-C subfamily serine protease